ncbi:F0F1 ATP synthase subunit epsilon [Burkholderia sp. MSMB1498]|uniref:F0F1 ATP synthase subunit epsilon n=1 Tax=Burkholderia sp. MSMB1498 TaxID=1637842 RepID=UPI00075DAA83|nr:F0F1 ATP synthase subunit epsilon [Burkholderia sp. MSMB1498]KVK91056.1 ATP synthase F0F1 subunit epsilon [Burkholderia sp. MSMB1498]
MPAELRLVIATPARVCVDDLPIVSLRAEDASGSFGIRAGHVDFVTLLRASVVRWRTAADTRSSATHDVTHYAAIDGGVLRVTRGSRIEIACREAVLGESLAELDAIVRGVRAAQLDEKRRARVDETRLHAQAMRRLLTYLRPEHAKDGMLAPLKPETLE